MFDNAYKTESGPTTTRLGLILAYAKVGSKAWFYYLGYLWAMFICPMMAYWCRPGTISNRLGAATILALAILGVFTIISKLVLRKDRQAVQAAQDYCVDDEHYQRFVMAVTCLELARLLSAMAITAAVVPYSTIGLAVWYIYHICFFVGPPKITAKNFSQP